MRRSAVIRNLYRRAIRQFVFFIIIEERRVQRGSFELIAVYFAGVWAN